MVLVEMDRHHTRVPFEELGAFAERDCLGTPWRYAIDESDLHEPLAELHKITGGRNDILAGPPESPLASGTRLPAVQRV